MSGSRRTSSLLKGVALAIAIVTLSIVLNPIVWRVCCYKPYSQPSGSMEPTLLVGDYWYASTWAHWWSPPQCGDVVVFRHPGRPSEEFVKRIIGLPGDTIQMRSGHVVLNGKELVYAVAPDFVEMDPYGNGQRIPQFVESLPEGKVVHVLDRRSGSSGDNSSLFRIPPDHYFLLGDNRDNSSDSRYAGPGDMGLVPAGNIIGRAAIVYASFIDGQADLDPGNIRWSRVLKLVE